MPDAEVLKNRPTAGLPYFTCSSIRAASCRSPTHPFDVGAPEWVDEACGFDLAHLVHREGLPHPGNNRASFRLAAEVMARHDSIEIGRCGNAGLSKARQTIAGRS
ncbi:MAG TPA: hypothetical protein VK659_15185 [Asanoa sp.]|jgi:hypothetical protein|nr:hypothetical protein [Asanoa sp.]